jgi:hypothetical protein
VEGPKGHSAPSQAVMAHGEGRKGGKLGVARRDRALGRQQCGEPAEPGHSGPRNPLPRLPASVRKVQLVYC